MPLRSDNYTVLVPKAEVARRLQIGRTSVLRILPGSQALKRVAKDPIREDRIQNEAVVDAYGPEERAMGWYYYLASKISFPLQAKCIAFKRVSLLRKGETVKVLR